MDPWLLHAGQVQQLVALAEEGDGEAAWMLYNHFAHERNPSASQYLLSAAHLGVPEAQCGHYSMLIQSPDRSIREKAVVWLERPLSRDTNPPRKIWPRMTRC